MTRIALPSAACLIALLSAPFGADQVAAQDELVIRVYRVSDLVLPRPDHPYQGLQLPGKAGGSSLLGSGYGGGGGGFGGGGFGGGGGGGGGSGGFFAVPDDVLGQIGGAGGAGGGSAGMGVGGMGGVLDTSGTSPAAIAVDELISAITLMVAPETWTQMGGPAVIASLRGMLIVKQTPAAHVEIERLLDALRDEGGVLRGVTIRAWWLPLDDKQLADLLGPDPSAAGHRLVRGDVLAQLAGSGNGYRGEVTCFDNQSVHIISGAVRTLVQGATPVVGGGQGEVGYMPIVERLHTGALLEVRPSLVDAQSVVLDIASFVTEWQKTEAPTELPSGPLDRPQFVAHQIATTIRAPLGQAIVVGGLTVSQPAVSEDGASTPGDPLYLVLEVTATDSPASDADGALPSEAGGK